MKLLSFVIGAAICAVVGFSGSAAAQQGDRALIFTGEGGYATSYTGLASAMTGAGAAAVDTSTSTLASADLSTYRIVFLMVNDGLTDGSRTTLVAFYQAGGTIVAVADGSGFRDAAPDFNLLTQALGLGDMFTSTQLDSGCSFNATPVAHPLSEGVTSLRYAYGSDVNGGDLVFNGTSMELVRAADRFVAVGDSNAMSEDCGTSPADSLTFYANLWNFASTCGNGVLDEGEVCDDGNLTPTDACVECLPAACGDGFVQEGIELCDGAGETADCNLDCTTAACGDGVLNVTAGEVCDDGGETDACDVDCTPTVCGDGFVNRTAGEACDDGNDHDNDACRTNCELAACGDGVTAVGVEACDGAGETADCNIDCSAAACGDGVLNETAGEECDDGNTATDDDCTATCTLPPGGCCRVGGTTRGEALTWLLAAAVFAISRRRSRRARR